MKRHFPLLIAILFIAGATGCYYDKADLIYPANGGPCDTSAVKFSVEITNILTNHCHTCHGTNTSASGGGIKLDTYANVKTWATESGMLASVSRTANPMPKGLTPLSSCQIAQIRNWIRNGAPQN